MADLRKLLDDATPGPWAVDSTSNHVGMREISGPSLTCRGFTIATDVDYRRAALIEADARLIALAPQLAAEVISLREREARLVEALRWMGAERNKQMRTADYHGDDCRCYRCAEDAVFAALAEIEKEAGE